MNTSPSPVAVTRRNFLKFTSAGAAALGVRALAGPGMDGANERLVLGIIGTGERGSALMEEIHAAAASHNVTIRAVCDVWQTNLKAAAARVQQWFGEAPRQCTRFGDLLALSELDAVVIATPDFAHGPILVAALEANKDVYVEKPMTIQLPLANQAFDLARAKQRIVQAGTQHRSEGRYRAAAREVATGVLGRLSRISAAMDVNAPRWARPYDDCRAEDVDWDGYLFNVPKRPFDPRLLRRWQLYKMCTNGLSGLWMSHYADSVNLLTGARYPNCAVSLGGIYVWNDGREHTDTFHTLIEYPEGFLFDWAMGLGNAQGIHFTLHGTQGTLDVEKWTVSTAGGMETTVQTRPIQGDPDQSHMGNWLQCLRTRQWPIADIEYGHQHAVATILSATALETGRRQRYDPVRRQLFAE